MKKMLICLLAALIIAPCLVPAAYAEEYTSGGWYAEFQSDGEIHSNFTSGTIAGAVNPLQPGDQVTITIEIRNAHPTTTDWYILNDVVESLEDNAASAAGGAYTYRLSYSGPGRTVTLFDGGTVGGETDEGQAEGLHGAVESLADYAYLDTLAHGQSGTVELLVALEAETQDNDYQDTQAQIDFRFAVELESPGRNRPVKTGDENNVGLYAGIMGVSGAVILLAALYGFTANRRSKKKGGEDGKDEKD